MKYFFTYHFEFKWTKFLKPTLLEKINAFSTESETFSAWFCHIFHVFFANGENATKFKETSKFSQEMLNILSTLKFAGSHLEFYEWKVSFSLISPRFFSLGNLVLFLSSCFNQMNVDKTFNCEGPFYINTFSRYVDLWTILGGRNRNGQIRQLMDT